MSLDITSIKNMHIKKDKKIKKRVWIIYKDTRNIYVPGNII